MLRVYPNLISLSTEKELLCFIRSEPKTNNEGLGRGIVRRYGVDYPLNNYHLQYNIPVILERQIRLLQMCSLVGDINSVTINEYQPNEVIEWHIDNKNTGEVGTVISLLSDTNICFRKGSEEKYLFAPRRSVYQFSGDERDNWQHSNVPTGSLRYSIVFRNCTL